MSNDPIAMQGPAPAEASLLGGTKSSSKAEGPCAYLDVSSTQALLSTTQHLPAYRGQSAAGGQRCRSPDRSQKRAQTATCAGQGNPGARTSSCASAASTSCEVAGKQPAKQLGIEADDSSSTAPSSRRPRYARQQRSTTDHTSCAGLQSLLPGYTCASQETLYPVGRYAL